MASELITTEYGLISSKLKSEKLAGLCVPKMGVQTGPFGSQLHKEDYVEVGTPIITVEHLGENRIRHTDTPYVSDHDKDRLSKYSLKEGDIVFSRVGSVDRRSLVRKAENGWLFSGRCLRVRVDKNKIDPSFLSYFFGYEGFKNYIKGIAVGATMPSINTKILSEIRIFYPPLEEQKAIAHILGSLDDKIELNRQMNETLEAMAQALFKSWFVDFDPVIDNALAAGNAIPDEFIERAEQRKAIEKKDNSDIQSLFPDAFEFTEEMGWIPKGWVNEPLSSFIEKSNTGADAIQKAPIVDYDTGIKCARIGDFSNNRDIASWGFSNVTDENFEKFKLLKGDILITRTSILGLSKIILEDLSAVYNNGLIRIRVNTNPIYVYQAFQTKEFRTYIDRITGESSTRPNMKISYLLEYPLLHPSTKLLKKASNIFSDSLVKRKELDLQVEIISKLRDTLLPKLISGELRISDAAELVSEVL